MKRVFTLKEIQDIGNELARHNDGWYKTVCVDSLTEIQDIDMRKIMEEAKKSARNPDMVNIDVPSPREYAFGRNHIRKICRHFRDLEVNTIITCLDYEMEEEGKPRRYGPNLPGKLRKEVPGFMRFVGYYHFNLKRERILQFAGTRQVIAKTRYPELGDLMTDPTIPKIWEIVQTATETEE